MKLFPEDPVFEVGTVSFDSKDEAGQPHDLLGRKPLGQRLTDLVDRIDQPLVIALDGGWGSGKSHFLKLWTGAHSKELGGISEIIYFDAFEHDFLDDPLVSLISRLATTGGERSWDKKAVKKLKKAAIPIVKFATRMGLAAATVGASELVGAVGDAMLSRASEASEASIERFWQA